MIVPQAANLNILCCTYPGQAHETYKRSLILDVVLFLLGFSSNIMYASSATGPALAVSGILFVCAAVLLFNAPDMASPLSSGLKTLAFFYGWVKVIIGWCLLIGDFIIIIIGIVLIAGGTTAANNNNNSSAAQAGGFFAGAIGGLLVVMGLMLLPFTTIITQIGHNLLRALNAMDSPAYFQPGKPGDYNQAPVYVINVPAPAPGYGAPAPGYGAPAPGPMYGAPTPGPIYGAPQPQQGYQPGYAPNQPQYH